MSKLSIKSHWLFYRELLLAEGLTTSELKRSERDFYAGAYGSLSTFVTIAQTYPKEESAKLMSDVHKECVHFLNDSILRKKPSEHNT